MFGIIAFSRLSPVTNHCGSYKSPLTPLYNGKDYVFNNQDKINLLADNYEKIYNNNINMGSVHFQKKIVRQVRTYLKNNRDCLNKVKLTSPNELREILKKCRNNKVQGMDEITYEILKKLPNKGLVYLTKIINSIMMNGYIFLINGKFQKSLQSLNRIKIQVYLEAIDKLVC